MKKLRDYQRNKKKIIIFDFDGVLAETIKIKGLVFYKIFEKEGRMIQNYAYSYHIKNAGINRKIKFKEIFKLKLKKILIIKSYQNSMWYLIKFIANIINV